MSNSSIRYARASVEHGRSHFRLVRVRTVAGGAGCSVGVFLTEYIVPAAVDTEFPPPLQRSDPCTPGSSLILVAAQKGKSTAHHSSSKPAYPCNSRNKSAPPPQVPLIIVYRTMEEPSTLLALLASSLGNPSYMIPASIHRLVQSEGCEYSTLLGRRSSCGTSQYPDVASACPSRSAPRQLLREGSQNLSIESVGKKCDRHKVIGRNPDFPTTGRLHTCIIAGGSRGRSWC